MSDRRPPTESELVEFVRSIDVRAPDSLHRQVDSLIAAASSRERRPHRVSSLGPAWGLAAGAVAVAVVALAVALSLGGSGSSTLSLRQASALTLSAATAPGPSESRRDGTALAAAVEGVSFPYWEDRFGWRSNGLRSDRVGGRAVTTVFYIDGHGHRIGYAIVAGSPAPALSGGAIAWRAGTAYWEFVENGAPAVVWLRHGHLCIVSGRGVGRPTLLALASWDERGSSAA